VAGIGRRARQDLPAQALERAVVDAEGGQMVDRVDSKSSAFQMPIPESCSMWQWLSTPPGRTQPARGVDLARAPRQLLRECDDPPGAHPDVGAERVRGGHHGAVADDEVEVWHLLPRADA
jgi:hypothetical protein